MTEWKKVKLKEVLKQSKEIITIKDSEVYKRCRVQVHRKGIVLRDIVKGSEIKTKSQQVCKKNQFLVAEIDAKVGGYGIVPDELEGAIVSSHYYLFDIDLSKLSLEYFRKCIITDEFFSQIKAEGSTNYASIRPKDVFNLEIPLPPLSNQEEIAKKMDYLFVNQKEFDSIQKDNINLISKLRQAILSDAVQGKLVPQEPNDEPASELLKKIQKEKEKLIKEGKIKKQKSLPLISEDEIPYELPRRWAWCRLGEIANYGHLEKIESKKLSKDTWLLDLEDIEKTTSRLIIRKNFGEVLSKSTKNVFQKGDVLYGKLRPYLDKVIVADMAGVCTTEIVPIRPYLINSYYLKCFLKNPLFLDRINSLTYGVKMPRLGTADAEKIIIPIPPLSEQKRIVEKVDKLMAYCDELEKQVKENQINSKQLMGAVLSESFRK